MKKETITTILVGIVLGVATAFGVIAFTKGKQQEQKKVISQSLSPTPPINVVTQKEETLEITSPQSEMVFDTAKTTLKGKAPKGATLVIYSPSDEVVLTMKEETFSTSFDLIEGENQILITSYHKKGMQEKSLVLYYIKQSL